MSLDLVNTIIKFLEQNLDQKFTARDIALWIVETYPDECRKKQQRSKATVNPINTDKALIQQLASEIGGARYLAMKKRCPNLKTTEGRPRKYYITESTDCVAIKQAESGDVSADSIPHEGVIKEHSLYPMLSEFLWSELGVYSKRIDEKRSCNSRGSGGNKWLYPDLAGMEDLSDDWHLEIKACVKEYANIKTKLWSFEVKILINRSNVRETFFQAVSNSSWANFGYLVARDIEGADTMKELRILAGLHGIGFIRLDTSNPSESQIMIPARERSEIDWDTANRLTAENKDFLKYIKLVRQFYQTGDVRRIDWD